ncbi:hypothetical protein CDD82_4889 [Ophiocordyceps australis]|uniref:Swiss Army Knife protein DSP-PTPase phosphatase domain-containing protein n=1 Tax=Ophiocordyceps australis TaxID=1399860 RepID=A0A2C5Z0P0_9HYPO|nr:hypothetical protein CDD82_4889 [Ophiocordyceps australis]
MRFFISKTGVFIYVALVSLIKAATGNVTSLHLYKRNDEFATSPPARACKARRILTGHGFARFSWITSEHLGPGDKIARSSAPHYNCKDFDQELTDESIEFLTKHNIHHVISLNAHAKSSVITGILKENNIGYTPIPIPDYSTPSLRDLQRGYEAFRESKGPTLIWCGYGSGRTGAMVSAIEIFRENEKARPDAVTQDEYDKNSVETRAQCKGLDRLQRVLDVEGAVQEISVGQEAYEEAQTAAAEYLMTSQSQSRSLAMTEARSKINRAVSTLSDAATIIDIQQQNDRTLLDRALEIVANPVRQGIWKTPLVYPLTEYIKEQNRQPPTLSGSLDCLKLVKYGLRAVILQFEASPAQTVPVEGDQISIDVQAIENFRKAANQLFESITSKIGELQKKAEVIRHDVYDPQDMKTLKERFSSLHRNLDETFQKITEGIEAIIGESDPLEELYDISQDVVDTAIDLAKMVDENPTLGKEDFADVRETLHQVRMKLAYMTTAIAKHYVQSYVVNGVRNRQDATYDQLDIEKESEGLMNTALEMQGIAAELGSQLHEKANCIHTIKDLLSHQDLDTFAMDAAIGVESTGTLWLKEKESAKEALEYELQTLRDEINTLQEPVQALLTTAVLMKREANLALAVTAQYQHEGGLTPEFSEWRKTGLLQLLNTLEKDAMEEKAAETAEKAAETKGRAAKAEEKAAETTGRAAQAEAKVATPEAKAAKPEIKVAGKQGGSDKGWLLALGLEIGGAVLAAVPTGVVQLAEVFLWARQAIRAIRFLRSAIMDLDITGTIVRRVEEITSKLSGSLRSWRVPTPAPLTEWATQKDAGQILEGLEILREAQAQPERSMDDLMSQLEQIHVPTEDPADQELEQPVSKLIKKLSHREVPLEPAGLAPPLPALLESRKTIDELTQELRIAANVPHHTSDVAFKHLLEEATAYLPQDCDINHDSLAFKIITSIQSSA